MGGHADRCEGPACLLGEMGSTEGLGRGVTMIQLTTKNESAGSPDYSRIRAGGRVPERGGQCQLYQGLRRAPELCSDQIRKTPGTADFSGSKTEFRFRQIKSETPTRFLRGPVNWQVVSREQRRLQITSCKSSAQR